MALKEIIANDKSLSYDDKKLYVDYATAFDKDLDVNLELTSIELNEKYGSDDIVNWRKFLKLPGVRNYINDFLDEIAEKQARKTLKNDLEHTRDALKVKESIEASYKGVDNSNIVVWFMPQKDYRED